jgi:hypothetical protein
MAIDLDRPETITVENFRESMNEDLNALVADRSVDVDDAPAPAPVATPEMGAAPAPIPAATPAPAPQGQMLTPEIVQALQDQGALRALQAAFKAKQAQAQAQQQRPVAPSDPVKAYYDDWKLPERAKDEGEEDYARRMLLSMVGHATSKVDGKREALEKRLEDALSDVTVLKKTYEAQRLADAEKNFMSLFEKTTASVGLKPDHPRYDAAKEYLLQQAGYVQNMGQANGWGEREWSAFLADRSKKAIEWWGPAPTPAPAGTPNLRVVSDSTGKPALAPISEGGGSGAPAAVGANDKIPTTKAAFKEAFANDVRKLVRS